MLESFWFWTGLGTFFGLIGAVVIQRLHVASVLRSANAQAGEWLASAQADADGLLASQRERSEELAQEAMTNLERELAPAVTRNQNYEEKIRDREEQLEESFQSREQARQKQEHVYRSRAGQLAGRQEKLEVLQRQVRARLGELQQALSRAAEEDIAVVKAKILSDLETEAIQTANRRAQIRLEEAEADLERAAKQMIDLALARFQRPYCAERGIGNVSFESPEVKERVLGPERKFLKALEKACGVDVSVNDEYQSASVLGYDPVRRELGRMTLEKMVAERRPLSEERVEQLMQACKKDLYKKIIQDGNRIARELRLEGMAEEVRHMMGALRYRYSFAQNQHFHCAEVGFLCGLLAGEMNLPVKDGRRSGLLHDIGKAMDHSRDGGHAVIGADFIEKHGEAPHIVHAVRAHHYDEPPSTDLAFLVIAADAISGARPGARRSTVDNYSQKIADLEKISRSFEGVIATYIMAAGREVRVIVNSDQVDDIKALQLSKQIARKIEEECSYPGLIRLTVVRETHAIEMAK